MLFLEDRDEDLDRRLTVGMEETASRGCERRASFATSSRRVHGTRAPAHRLGRLEDQDILRLARQGSEACVQIFFVRRGRLLGREAFFLDRLGSATDGDLLSALLRQFYSKTVPPPREVLLSTEVPEEALLEDWLGELRGGRVGCGSPNGGRSASSSPWRRPTRRWPSRPACGRRPPPRVVARRLRPELGLPDAPHRIEGLDISNIQGQEAVGSMVVWEAGGMKKDAYKRFKIRTVPGADDYAMMAEVLRRRYGKALEEGGTLPTSSCSTAVGAS